MIRQLYEKGISISELSKRFGISRTTARKYAKSLYLPEYKERNEKQSLLDPYKTYIDSKLADAPYTAVRLFREIQRQSYTGSYDVVLRYVRKVRAKITTKAVWRFETEPGHQSQVDWLERGTILLNGIEHKLYGFSMILGYSRLRYLEFTLSKDTENFIKCHINAFNFFEGCTREILYDNLKQAILKRVYDIKECKLNPKFADFSGYYGFKPRFCRPFRAKTKGKIENTIKYVKYDFLMGAKASSLEDLNNQARVWLDRVNSQVHGTTKEIPLERFRQENLISIRDAPPYDTSKVLTRKVSPECYVHYQGNRYSVPFKYAGCLVELKVDDSTLSVYFGKDVLCNHSVLSGMNKTSKDKEHFKGLLKQIRNENSKPFRKSWVVDCDAEAAEVEKRDLSVYDEAGGLK